MLVAIKLQAPVIDKQNIGNFHQNHYGNIGAHPASLHARL
jgi:hypothetical protein